MILDNYEHLVDDISLIADIFTQAPDVRVMVTSRETLNLEHEWVWEVSGLDYPTANDSNGTTAFHAVELFVARARQIQRTFSLEDEQSHIWRICQLVGGMPLALELAATWVKTLSCAEIAQAIEQDIGFLKARLRDVSDRHRSMQVVIDQSWQQLNEDERTVFMRLSVFPRSFTLEAAHAITGASLSILASLIDKSMLSKDSDQRFIVAHGLFTSVWRR